MSLRSNQHQPGTIALNAGCSSHQPRRNTMVTEARETGNLIGSDKVEGTAVYGADKTKIGSIERVMIDKISGKVAYAVMSFGGFLGMGRVSRKCNFSRP